MTQSLTNQKYLCDVLHKFGFFTKKSMWQNFLVDQDILDKIIESAQIDPSDEVLEIGPGPWVLTNSLLKTWAKITSLEIDKDIIKVLEYTTWKPNNLMIINQNALEYKPQKSWYILCANIPYYITSPIIRHYLWWSTRPKRVILLVQKEVAQKICAKKWDYSVLSLQVSIYWNPKIICYVNKESFFPAPKVDSAVLYIDVYDNQLINKEDIFIFWDIAHHVFNEKRKKIINTLSKYREMWVDNAKYLLEKTWIDINVRPQELTIDDWNNLIKNFKKIYVDIN